MIIKHTLLAAVAFAAVAFTSCGNATDGDVTDADSVYNLNDTTTTAATPEGTQVAASSIFSTADTSAVLGSARFYQLADGQIRLDLEINMKDRADSNVAVHFHDKGACGNKGEDAGGHWNPTGEDHGEWGAHAHHSGDIGNLTLDANGQVKKSITSDRWSIADTAQGNIIGKSIIVHSGKDDYTTQPTGNSGPRAGCGIITKL